MPNWTSNIIRIEGHERDLAFFLDCTRGPEAVLDFNRIIPMPDILRHTAGGHCCIDGQDVTAWYVRDAADLLQGNDEVRLFTPEEEAELAMIGHRSWYSWCVENWGTKWNACRAEISKRSPDSGLLEIRFDTAWDAPVPIYERLLALFPQLGFWFSWQHEGSALCYAMRRRLVAA
jgi:hypothetical protein